MPALPQPSSGASRTTSPAKCLGRSNATPPATRRAAPMNHMIAVRRYAAGDAPAAAAIIRGLPDHFTGEVPGQVERDAASHEAWVLTDSGAVAGIAVPARTLQAEPGACHLLRDSGAVQVGRDPAEVEGPAGAQDHAQVDVLGAGHDTLVEHQPDLLGQRLEGTLPYLLRGRRPVTAGQQGRDRLIDGEVGLVDRGLARLHHGAELR